MGDAAPLLTCPQAKDLEGLVFTQVKHEYDVPERCFPLRVNSDPAVGGLAGDFAQPLVQRILPQNRAIDVHGAIPGDFDHQRRELRPK